VSLAADALGLLRLGAAVAMPREIAAAAADPGSWGPVCLFAIAATSDFLDGRLARATSRPTAHGALLDTVADVSFVLAAIGSGAAIGLVTWAAPLAIVAAVVSYALASLRRSTHAGAWRLARRAGGHHPLAISTSSSRGRACPISHSRRRSHRRSRPATVALSSPGRRGSAWSR